MKLALRRDLQIKAISLTSFAASWEQRHQNSVLHSGESECAEIVLASALFGFQMRISFVQPRQELRSYIEAFWVLESPTGISLTSRTLAVPNGCPKLIIPYKNSFELSRCAADAAAVASE